MLYQTNPVCCITATCCPMLYLLRITCLPHYCSQHRHTAHGAGYTAHAVAHHSRSGTPRTQRDTPLTLRGTPHTQRGTAHAVAHSSDSCTPLTQRHSTQSFPEHSHHFNAKSRNQGRAISIIPANRQ